eukprot:gene17148-biopygen2306
MHFLVPIGSRLRSVCPFVHPSNVVLCCTVDLLHPRPARVRVHSSGRCFLCNPSWGWGIGGKGHMQQRVESAVAREAL